MCLMCPKKTKGELNEKFGRKVTLDLCCFNSQIKEPIVKTIFGIPIFLESSTCCFMLLLQTETL